MLKNTGQVFYNKLKVLWGVEPGAITPESEEAVVKYFNALFDYICDATTNGMIINVATGAGTKIEYPNGVPTPRPIVIQSTKAF